MTSTIRYHRGNDNQYRLEFIHADKDESRQYAQRRRSDQEVVDATVMPSRTADGEIRYPVYVIKDISYELVDSKLKDDENIEDWIDQNFTEQEVQVLAVVLDSLGNIINKKADQGELIQFYKQADLEKIPQILDAVEWGSDQSVGTVGARLLSEFILTHPLPNANHRTALTLLDRYLTTIDTSFEMPDTGETDLWYPWVKDYIHESKRLTTLRRKSGIFVYVSRLGSDVVERKGGIRIDLDEYPIDRPDSFDYFTQEHHELSEQFVIALTNEADVPELVAVPDDGKKEFLDKLSGSSS